MKRYICVDAKNILYRSFYVHKNEDELEIVKLAHHTALMMIYNYYKQFKPDKIIMCFDRLSWRVGYTESEECLSQKLYKGNRRQKMTPSEKQKYKVFTQHVDDFEKMIREHTSIVALGEDRLEADDLLAGLAQMLSLDGDEVIIVSTDKDLIQLLEYPNVRLINPGDGKDRSLKEWNNDAELFLFEKCIRGDAGDNVQSAYPRVRKTRILKAYTDDFERNNLMNETWKHIDGRTFTVKDLFKENRLLMRLDEQPEDIKESIIKTILHGLHNPGKFDYHEFMQYCGRYDLQKVSESSDTLIPMLNM